MNGIYFIGGSEPYLVDCQKLSLIDDISVKELNYMEADAFTDAAYQFLYTYPIGDAQKIVYVTVEKLSDMNIPLFWEYHKTPSEFGVLIVRFREYDSRHRFYKELKKEGLIQLFDKESAIPGLFNFIKDQAAKKGAYFADKQTLDLFISRENYANRDDITLYNILGDLNNLIALNKQITKELVLSVIPDHLKDNAFAIATYIVSKDIKGLRSQAILCQGNEIGTLSALLWAYRIAYKAHYFSMAEIGATKNTLHKLSKEQVIAGIKLITDGIDSLKSNSVPKSVVLEQTFLRLAFDYSNRGIKTL